jgi:hypothetical protein
MPRLSVHTDSVREATGEGGESDEDMPGLVYVSEHWAGHYDYPILPDIEAEPLACSSGALPEVSVEEQEEHGYRTVAGRDALVYELRVENGLHDDLYEEEEEEEEEGNLFVEEDQQVESAAGDAAPGGGGSNFTDGPFTETDVDATRTPRQVHDRIYE